MHNKLRKPRRPSLPIPPTPAPRKLTKRRSHSHFHLPLPQTHAPPPPPLPMTKRSSLLRNFSLRSLTGRKSLSTATPPSSFHLNDKYARATVSEHGHHTPTDEFVLPWIPPMSQPSHHNDDQTIPWVLTSASIGHPNGVTSLVPDHQFAKKPKFTLGDEFDPDILYHSPESSSSHGHDSIRPRLIRRDARRRWTLATALMDDAITDEVFVDQLEKMRIYQDRNGTHDNVSLFWDVGREIWEDAVRQDNVTTPEQISNSTGDVLHASPDSENGLNPESKITYTPSLPSFPIQHRMSTPAPASNASWQTARRALLACRELVRTERHYLSSLRILLSAETASAPPPLMLRYAGELVKVSERLLARMEENPSAWGVAAAFLGNEESVDAAYVGWCGVVGSWFDSSPGNLENGSAGGVSTPNTPRRKLSKIRIDDEKRSRRNSTKTKVKTHMAISLESMGPLRRTVSTWRRSLPSMSNLDMSVVTSNSNNSSPVFGGSFFGSKKEKDQAVAKQPLVRDLAILPTQRVTRYVLLYRDILLHTPSTSPSRAIVERAVDAACRIAQKCDRAQDNAAFLGQAEYVAPTPRKVRIVVDTLPPQLDRTHIESANDTIHNTV